MNVELISFLDIPYEVQMETRHWRNSEQVAKYFKIPYITEDVHKNWLHSLKQKMPKAVAFLIKVNGKNVGVTYFHSIDYKKKEADWGIYIYDSNLRGLGIGKKVLDSCLEYARKKISMSVIYLDVLKDNYRAISLYEAMGFVRIDLSDNVFLRYKKDLLN